VKTVMQQEVALPNKKQQNTQQKYKLKVQFADNTHSGCQIY